MVLTRRFGTPGLFCRKIRFLRQSLSYPAAFRAAGRFFLRRTAVVEKIHVPDKKYISFRFTGKAADYGCFEREVQRFYPEKAGFSPKTAVSRDGAQMVVSSLK